MIISAGQEGKTKTALQMIGIVALLLGYPYHMTYWGFDCGTVRCARGTRARLSLLLFSIASAAQYVRLFGTAVAAKEHRQVESLAPPSGS